MTNTKLEASFEPVIGNVAIRTKRKESMVGIGSIGGRVKRRALAQRMHIGDTPSASVIVFQTIATLELRVCIRQRDGILGSDRYANVAAPRLAAKLISGTSSTEKTSWSSEASA